jgi:tungstate transport system ATP-binding protein
MPDSAHQVDARSPSASAGRDSLLPIEANGVQFEAAGRHLIDGVDLRLEDLALTVVLGPNGAGKSLMLRLLHGLIAPSAGTIRFGGRPSDREIRKRQAMVFQRPVLLRRSALANIRYALRMRGEPRRRAAEKALEALRRAGLGHLAERPARVLSAGEQQRLALARALSLDPEILFLDEPTANLDPESTLAIEARLRLARDNGTKIVLVTHDLGQARRLAEHLVFVHRGRIAEAGAAETFFRRPVTDCARAYLDGRIVL